MKYYLIAGEASGDLHGANLMKAIRKNDPEAQFRFWGGDKMQAVGGELVKHYRDLAFMGFVEVLKNIFTIRKNFALCKKELRRYVPDVVIFIDYPGFNLRMAKFAHKMGLKTVFYISPTVWAWKTSRVRIVKKYVDRMMVILPFEKEFYARYDYPVDFVGHPLLDELQEEKVVSREAFLKHNGLPDWPLVALLPGSREQEISKILPEMQRVAEDFPDFQFVVAGVKSVSRQVYAGFHLPVVYDATHALLRNARAALVASGTATLETALFGVPQVVGYKINGLTYVIAQKLVHVKYISLVNLILDREVVKELIQKDYTKEKISQELRELLYNEQRRKQLSDAYVLLKKKLGSGGASQRAAAVIAEVAGGINSK